MGKLRLFLLAGLAFLAGAAFTLLLKEEPHAPTVAQSPETSVSAPAEPAAASPAPEQAAVEIYPEKQKLAGIRTAEVAVKPLKRTIRTTGRVEFDERRLTTVNIKIDGWVEKLYADYNGKHVKKGESLAEIFSPELVAVQLEYLNLTKWKKDQLAKFQRNLEFTWGDRYGTTGRMITWDHEALIEVARQKFELWGFTPEEIRKLDETREPTRLMTVRSPASGYVYQKPAFRGTRVSPGDKILDIVDLSTVWVLADLYENEIPLVHAGQTAKITIGALPGETLTAKVDFVYPFLSGQTRTSRARIVLHNRDLKIKPQMFANVEIETDLGERLAIPREAILETGRRQIVYVDRGGGWFEPRQVRIGVRGDQWVEVLAGLEKGEKVASRAVFLIDSEAKLKGIGRP
jgi:Cu(I)/Ag(I) efflux system membrane fusion protein